MLHRVFVEPNKMYDIYNSRIKGLAVQYHELTTYIDSALELGFYLGSLVEAIENPKCIHLTFDDGYKEHLIVAKLLRKKYGLERKDLTFCINVNNCTQSTKICTDVFYYLFQVGEFQYLKEMLIKYSCSYESISANNFLFNFDRVKKVFSLNISRLLDFFQILCNRCKELGIELPFLTECEVVELSKYATIASHAIHHYHLDCLNEDEAKKELEGSKKILEKITKTQIEIFCYPDGSNSKVLQNYCKIAGYHYALSINSKDFKNVYCIPRCLNIRSLKN